jgi:cyclase
VEERGAGEILFTSMDNDGTKNGFANNTLAKLSTLVKYPIIASGGAGSILWIALQKEKPMRLWRQAFFI